MNRLKTVNWVGATSFVVVLLLWELCARGAPDLQLYLPPVTAVLSALARLLAAGPIAAHMLITLERFLAGYLIAAALGVGLGLALGYFRFLHDLLGVVIEFLRPMPSVAIIPVAILLLGIGDSMIIAVTVYASVWSILINTVDGVRHIESRLIETGRTFGLNRWRILWRIVLPGASPYIVTGLRIALAIALILVTTAEMIAGGKGLGFFILDQERSMNSTNMYAGVLAIAALGYALNRIFLVLEGRVMRWHRGMAGRGTG